MHICLSCQCSVELKYVEFVVHFVPNGDVRFEVGHNDLWGHSTSPRRLMSLNVTEYCVLCGVQTIHHIVHNVVVPPGPSAGIHGHFADVETVCSGLAPFTQFAFV